MYHIWNFECIYNFCKYEFVILTISNIHLTGLRDVYLSDKTLFPPVKLFFWPLCIHAPIFNIYEQINEIYH